MGRFATTIFSTTQHCNVGTMLEKFETTSQQCCNAVLRQTLSLRIVSCNIALRKGVFLGVEETIVG